MIKEKIKNNMVQRSRERDEGKVCGIEGTDESCYGLRKMAAEAVG